MVQWWLEILRNIVIECNLNIMRLGMRIIVSDDKMNETTTLLVGSWPQLGAQSWEKNSEKRVEPKNLKKENLLITSVNNNLCVY